MAKRWPEGTVSDRFTRIVYSPTTFEGKVFGAVCVAALAIYIFYP